MATNTLPSLHPKELEGCGHAPSFTRTVARMGFGLMWGLTRPERPWRDVRRALPAVSAWLRVVAWQP